MLLSKSSRSAGNDVAANMLHFFQQTENESKEKELKREIAKLCSIRDKLKRRATNLSHDLDSSSEASTTKKPKPLSEHNKELGISGCTSFCSLEESEAKTIQFLESRHLECFKLAFGVHISSRNASKITFDFTPNNDGVLSKDVYKIVLARETSIGLVLDSAVLPSPKSLEPKLYDFKQLRKSKKFYNKDQNLPVIPLQRLADEVLPKVDQFVKAAKLHLDAYISRFNQLAKIAEVYTNGEVHSIKYNHDLTKIQLALTIGENHQDGNEDVSLHLAFQYNLDSSRPEAGSLKMKLSGSGKDKLDDQAVHELKDQCYAFYKYPIDVAITQAFLQ